MGRASSRQVGRAVGLRAGWRIARVARRRAAAAAMEYSNPQHVAPRVGGSILAPDARGGPKSVGRGRRLRYGAASSTGTLTYDPAVALAYKVRHAFDPADRQPGPCRVIDPKTGAVIVTLDPFTRQAIPSALPLTPRPDARRRKHGPGA